MRCWWLTVCFCSLFLGGCGSPPWLEVIIDGRELDQLGGLADLLVVAAAVDDVDSASPTSCARVERNFISAAGGVDFPVSVVFVQNDREWDCIAVEVVGFCEEGPVIHTEGLYCDWAQSESVTLLLEPACDLRAAPPPPNCDDNASSHPATCRLIDGEPQCTSSRVLPLIYNDHGSTESCDSVD